MECQEAQTFLDGYLDGELDLARSLELEQHLGECSACARSSATHGALRSMLHDPSLYHRAPEVLRQRVRSGVRAADRAASPFPLFSRRWLALAACVALIAGGVVVLLLMSSGRSPEDLLASEVVSDHVRSLMGQEVHLWDVKSENPHTVKPWFAGKLDYSPPVVDLKDDGYPLAGGRLDLVNGRPVAALVYRRSQHVINLFVWPANSAGDEGVKMETKNGYNVAYWTKSGMTCWAVSDANEAALRQFADLFERQRPATTQP